MNAVWIFTINVLSFLTIGQGFLLDSPKPTDQQSLVIYLDATVTQLANLTLRLQQDIQKKNDLTQFLQENVKQLNTTLAQVTREKASLETRVTKLEADLANALASSGELTDDLRSTKTLARNLQTQLQATNQTLARVQTDQQLANATLTQQLGAITSSLAVVTHNVTNIGTAQAQTPSHTGSSVSFTYRSPNHTIPATEDQTLKFYTRITDNGGDYSSTTGVFTAPVGGTYWFGLTLAVTTDNYLNCYIVRDGHEFLAEVYSSTYMDESSLSSHAVTHLNAGETIAILGCHGSGKLNKYRTSFTGMLINED